MLHSEPTTLVKPVNALVQVVQPHILGGPDVSVRSPPPQSSGLLHQAPEKSPDFTVTERFMVHRWSGRFLGAPSLHSSLRP